MSGGRGGSLTVVAPDAHVPSICQSVNVCLCVHTGGNGWQTCIVFVFRETASPDFVLLTSSDHPVSLLAGIRSARAHSCSRLSPAEDSSTSEQTVDAEHAIKANKRETETRGKA